VKGMEPPTVPNPHRRACRPRVPAAARRPVVMGGGMRGHAAAVGGHLATPWGQHPRYLIHDRDRVYGADFANRLAGLGIESIRTPSRRPGRTLSRSGSCGSLQPMPRIPYADISTITDPEILDYLEDARLHGTPRPESQAIRANVPAVMRAFSQAWDLTFRNGVCDHALKELCRVYVSKSIDCEY
jgi:hypothetical protein